MRRHVAHRSPLEACGLLSGMGYHVSLSRGIPNLERSPVRFRMQPQAQWRFFQRIEAAGQELLGIYHSHPAGPSTPSPTDLRQALYPVAQVIWSMLAGRWQARAFIYKDGRALEIPIQILPDV